MLFPRRIINIVNFIRYDDPRYPQLNLLEPVVQQMRLLKRYGLPATWLLQFDALVAGPYTAFLKSELPKTHEVGLWLEINRMHCGAAGIEFHGADGLNWDYAAKACLTVGYTPEERERLVDVAIARFTEIWGMSPSSVAAWYIDAHTLAYLAECYGVIASANCREQVGTDGYTVWGGIFNGGYYPSRQNALCPAQSSDGQIPLPVFRMLGADPIHQYDLNLGEDAQHDVLSLEPVYPQAGGDAKWVRRYLDIIAFAPTLSLAYAQAGQENSFGWAAMRKGYKLQMKELARRRATGELEIECLRDTGRWFRETFSRTPVQTQVALADTLGGSRRSVWYHSQRYRVNVVSDDAAVYIRDMHLFAEAFAEPHLVPPCTSRAMQVTTLPVLDGFGWSTAEARAKMGFGVRLVGGRWETLRLCGEVTVDTLSSERLCLRMPTDRGVLVMCFESLSFVVSLDGGEKNDGVLCLRLFIPNGTGEVTLSVYEQQLAFVYDNFAYAVMIDGQTVQVEDGVLIVGDDLRLGMGFEGVCVSHKSV